MPNPVSLEIVACSPEDATIAQSAGADRIELCVAIEIGGLTPTIGLAKEVLDSCELPVVAMLRPRAGGFCYSESEISTMLRDAESLVQAGVHGLVFGVLTDNAVINESACRRLLAACGPCEKVFHRAFDGLEDPHRSLEILIELGFTRVMTSGQAPSALEGADLIRELTEQAGGRIEVMPGGGVRASNIAEIMSRTGADSVHAAPRKPLGDSYQGSASSSLDGQAVAALAQITGKRRLRA